MSVWDWVLLIVAALAFLVGLRGLVITAQAFGERNFGGGFVMLAMALVLLAGGGFATYQALLVPYQY